MSDVNLVKLFAPEMIPEPLRLDRDSLETYTKKLYDYLRRLQGAMGFIISQLVRDIGATSQVTSILVHVTQGQNGVVLDTRDWRGQTVWFTIKETAGDATYNDAVWNGGDGTVSAFEAGTGFDAQGAPPTDYNFHSIAATGGSAVNLYIQNGTGHIIADFVTFTANYYVQLVLLGAPMTKTITV